MAGEFYPSITLGKITAHREKKEQASTARSLQNSRLRDYDRSYYTNYEYK